MTEHGEGHRVKQEDDSSYPISTHLHPPPPPPPHDSLLFDFGDIFDDLNALPELPALVRQDDATTLPRQDHSQQLYTLEYMWEAEAS